MKKPSESAFRITHFAQSKVTRNALEDRIKILLSDSFSNAIQATVQLLIVYLVGTILFSLSNMIIVPWIFSYIDPIGEIGRYAWARAVHEHLMQFIPKAAKKVNRKERGAKESTGYINGCVVVLMVWLFERTGIVKPSTYGRLSRILNWEKPQFMKWVHCREVLKGLKEGNRSTPSNTR